QRGEIRDRNGHPLVVSVKSFRVTANPKKLPKPDQLAQAIDRLAPILGRSPDQLRLQLTAGAGDPLVLVDDLAYDRGVELERLLDDNWWITGIELTERGSRRYPEGNLASALLGFIGKDQSGLTGIEADFNVELTGRVGELTYQRDTGGGIIPIGPIERQAGVEGAAVVLTIDRHVQRIVERELDRVIAEQQAEGGSIVVMDPQTGEILGLASRPSFDLTKLDLAKGVDLNTYRNRVITDMYEPGSVFKVVGMAAALDQGLVQPETTMHDPGQVVKGGWTLRNWDGKANGVQTMTEVLIHSSNVGMVWVSDRLGPERFYQYVDAFGFTQPTRVGLTGEAPGMMRRPGGPDWQPIDLATNSFGQALTVTPLQVASMMATVANGGTLIRPSIVKAIVGAEGTRNLEPVEVRRVMKPETAEKLIPMLVAVTEEGETNLAMVPGYRVGGKTGTASIATGSGYDESQTIAQFVGFAPAEEPRFVIHVKVDRPKNSPWGSVVASPVFSQVAAQLLNYYEIPPSRPLPTPTPARN
ncbi:MAG TPA: penicillin-binding protein 2, partial [Dehalococcoidia bacterium]|nr:penicillin-binding protein 2 [Dehalococcoidia bacterium]